MLHPIQASIIPGLKSRFVVKHHVEDVFDESLSGGGVGNAEETLKGLKPIDEIKRMLGGVPHEMEGVILGGRDHVQKIMSTGTVPGEWVVKRLIYGIGMPEFDIGLIKSDHLIRETGREFFSPLVFPEGYAYQSGDNLYMVTKYIDSDEDLEHFNSMGPKLKARVAFHSLGFGAYDLKGDNLRKVTGSNYPMLIEHYEDEVPQERLLQYQTTMKNPYANIDTGISFTGEPRKITLRLARTHLTDQAPFVDVHGNNSLSPYKRENARWTGYIDDKEFLRRFYTLCDQIGLDREEAEKYLNEVLRPNLANFILNVDMYCAAANNELPSTLLEKENWHGSKNPTQTDFTGNSIEKIFSPGEQIVLDLNDGFLLLVELVDGGKLRVKNLFYDSVEKIVEKNGTLSIGKVKDNNMSLPNCSIGENHVLIENIGGGKVLITDRQSRLPTRYWE